MTVSNVNELIADMGIGWNLGNTFESYVANPDRSDLYRLARTTPTAWGTPSTRTWFFDAIKHAGFKTVRIPITWSNHIDPTNNTIDIEYLDHINEFVSYIVNTLDMYCIINMHHDERIWFNANTLVDNPALMQKYTHLWTQIASYFKDYGEKLIFAGLNETLDSQERWDNADSVGLANVNTIHQNFVTAVRAVSGNENRYLCINAYASKVYALKALVLPDNKCFADVHLYSTSPDDIKLRIDEASSYGKPYIIGEFGISKEGYNSIEAVSSQCFMVTYARTKGVSCVLWDDYGNMQFLRRNRVTQSNYRNAQNFNGFLIDLPNILVESENIKPSELQVSNRSDYIRVGETVEVYPANIQLNKITYNFSSNNAVARFVEGTTDNHLTGIGNGQTLISSFSPYGHVAQKQITVGEQNGRVLDNYALSLQNIDNWSVSLSRIIDVLPSTPYMIKCPADYTITLDEMNGNGQVIKSTLISEDHYFETSIVTQKLKITIEHVSKKDYNTISRDFYNNVIDMSILYSKYQNEVVTEYKEFPRSTIPTENIILSQSSYHIASSDVTFNLNDFVTIAPANSTEVVRFNAVDPSIVHVSLNGIVTPLKEGTTNITIRSGNKSAEFNVIVNYTLSNAKENLADSIQEQLYVQEMMVARGITNADKQELDALINTSQELYNSSTATSSQIYDHIELAHNKLFLFTSNNALYYKYISSKADSNAGQNILTNMLFDDTKKLVVTFGVTQNKSATFVSGTSFSLRYENKDIRIVYGSQGMLRTQKLNPGPLAMYTLEVCKGCTDRAIVLNDEILAALQPWSTVPANTPLSISVIHKAFRLFNIRVYDQATNNLLYNLMPLQVDDKLVMLDTVNNVQNEIGTTSTHELGSLME